MTHLNPSRYRCVHELFEAQAEQRPQAVALRLRGQTMTYAELDDCANAIAGRLLRLGLGADVLVGVMMERSFEMIAALLGILKAGAAFVPLDPADPYERLRFLINDTGMKVLLTHAATSDRAAKLDVKHAILLDAAPANRESIPKGTADRVHFSSESLASIMYTSGTTGKPKGVMVPHRAIARLVTPENRSDGAHFMEMSEDHTFLQLAPLSFDASTLEIWAPLANGGALALMPPGTASLEAIGEEIRASGVTAIWLTAGLFNLMVEQRLEDLRPLQQLLVGGDVLSPWHVKRAFDTLRGTRLINGYGPTENTTFTCCHTIVREDTLGPMIPIGMPIHGTQVFVVDAAGSEIPVGGEGELCVAGDGLALGYWNRPELTSEKFVLSPLVNGARIYRTGDRARHRADGALEFLGRTDQQVKISGHRIELGEIESALLSHPSVHSAAVIAVPPSASKGDPNGDPNKAAHREKRLTAFVVAQQKECIPESLREHLRSQLPPYMVPAAFEFVPVLPLTANGKLDRVALAELLASADGETTAYVPAAPEPARDLDNVAGRVAKIWQRMLGVTAVSLDTNFFDAGGDSLQLLAVHAELEKEFGKRLSVTDLFELTTVRVLAEKLSGDESNHDSLQNEKTQDRTQERARAQRAAWQAAGVASGKKPHGYGRDPQRESAKKTR